MADKKISQLTAATTPLAGTEVLPIVQSSSTVKVSVSDLTAGRNVAVNQLNSITIRKVSFANLTVGNSITITGVSFVEGCAEVTVGAQKTNVGGVYGKYFCVDVDTVTTVTSIVDLAVTCDSSAGTITLTNNGTALQGAVVAMFVVNS
jgi:hypothetical protein